MTEIVAEILVVVPFCALALHLWLRARRAEALLVAGDREHREVVAEITDLAERDPLTGVANRRAFNRALAELQHRAGTARAGALILIDLDNFKYVNDRLGHQRGDEVLRQVARAIRRRVRDTDLVARLGGDEFAVVLQGVDAERAPAVADGLRAGIREAVADEFRRNFSDRGELGAACAVYHRGRKMVDLWGGHRDRAATLPWEEDTLVVVYSTSKGMAATTVAVAHARRLLDYDNRVVA